MGQKMNDHDERLVEKLERAKAIVEAAFPHKSVEEAAEFTAVAALQVAALPQMLQQVIAQDNWGSA
jgi:hypothetical protein